MVRSLLANFCENDSRRRRRFFQGLGNRGNIVTCQANGSENSICSYIIRFQGYHSVFWRRRLCFWRTPRAGLLPLPGKGFSPAPPAPPLSPLIAALGAAFYRAGRGVAAPALREEAPRYSSPGCPRPAIFPRDGLRRFLRSPAFCFFVAPGFFRYLLPTVLAN
jgi:hypothetical protein